LIATATIETGEVIMPARIDGKRTPAGRYTNHAKDPTAIMIERLNGNIDLVALRDIRGCSGGDDGEEITIDYRQALELQIKRAA
jgi:SET domain-containing protein